MAKATETKFDFTIEVDGKAYNCHRVVSGARVFRQRIYVDCIGSKPDGASYGSGGMYPAGSMERIARIIAGELVRQNAQAG